MPTVPAGSKMEAELLALAEHRGAVIGGAMVDPRAAPEPPPVFKDEGDLQNAIVKQAKAWGWIVWRTSNSRGSEPGFPDLIMIRRDRLIAAELKRSRKEKPSQAQRRWLRAFQGVPGAFVYVWSPEDWDTIIKELS